MLQGKRINYETRDVAADEDLRTFMKEKSGQASPPQIFNDDTYLGVNNLIIVIYDFFFKKKRMKKKDIKNFFHRIMMPLKQQLKIMILKAFSNFR